MRYIKVMLLICRIKYQFGFWYKYLYFYENSNVMRRELLDFSEMIDEKFEPVEFSVNKFFSFLFRLFN